MKHRPRAVLAALLCVFLLWISSLALAEGDNFWLIDLSRLAPATETELCVALLRGRGPIPSHLFGPNSNLDPGLEKVWSDQLLAEGIPYGEYVQLAARASELRAGPFDPRLEPVSEEMRKQLLAHGLSWLPKRARKLASGLIVDKSGRLRGLDFDSSLNFSRYLSAAGAREFIASGFDVLRLNRFLPLPFGLHRLREFKSLRVLDLGSLNITEEAAQTISGLPSLTHLKVMGISAAAARYLARSPTLTHLAATALRADAAIELAKSKTLTHLDVSYSSNGDAIAEAFQNSPTLRQLRIEGCSLSDVGAEFLSRIQSLESLSVGFNRLGDRGAAALARLRSLIFLKANFNRIENAGAQALAASESLSGLDLSHNRIADDGAHALARNPKLLYLKLAFTLVSRQAVEAMFENQGFLGFEVGFYTESPSYPHWDVDTPVVPVTLPSASSD
jgi:hypothetical protein